MLPGVESAPRLRSRTSGWSRWRPSGKPEPWMRPGTPVLRRPTGWAAASSRRSVGPGTDAQNASLAW